MKHLRSLIIAVAVPALILVVFAVSSVVASGPLGKSTVCHIAGDKIVEITVNDHAVPAHLAHGDFVDDYGDCTASP
jgi:hypothetical protein